MRSLHDGSEPVITCVSAFDEDRPGTVGPLVASTEGRIVDPETGRDVEAGQPGEVRARGPRVMPGDLGNDETTAATIVDGGGSARATSPPPMPTAGPPIADRLKELIKVTGYQVAPAELEALPLTHTAIAEGCVNPVPHDEAGERPNAFVVLHGEAELPESIA